MLKKSSFIGTAILMIVAVAILAASVPAAGAAGADDLIIPAPLADPTVCGYFRLKDGFVRLMSGDGPLKLTGPSGSSAPEQIFSHAFHAAAQARKQVRAHARGELMPVILKGKTPAESGNPAGVIQLIRSFSTARKFIPEDMYIYVRGLGEYAVMITGSVVPKAWEGLFEASARLPRATGFTVNPAGADGSADRPILHIGPGYLLLCPAGLEGNLLDALQAGATLDPEKWKVFRRMAGLKPVAALEADLEGLLERCRGDRNGTTILPFPYDKVQVLRCLIDSRVIKAQLYSSDENARVLLRQAAGVVAKALKSMGTDSLFADSLGSVNESMQQTSVFIEGRGLEQNAPLAGISTLGMISQLICRALPEMNLN